MQVDNMFIFVRVVQAGSFTKAAKSLGMPITTVSGKVQALEKSLGTTLLKRTTRTLHITEDGEVIYRHGVKALDEIKAAQDELSAKKSEPEGTLKITAPNDFAQSYFLPLLRGYLDAYPKIKLELILTNRVVDLINEGIDLAIRVGDLKDSTLITREFSRSTLGLWVSPSYLKKHGRVKSLKDLKNHECLRYREFEKTMKLTDGKKTLSFEVNGRILADDFVTLKEMTLRGEGIGFLPEFICREEEKQGKLIHIFPDWSWMNFKFSFVYPAQRFVSPKVQSFINWVVRHH